MNSSSTMNLFFQETCEFIGVNYKEQHSVMKKEIKTSSYNVFVNSTEASEYISKFHPDFFTREE